MESNQFFNENRQLVIFEGIVFILLGLLAMTLPLFFTLALEQLIGFLFLFGGCIQSYRVLKSQPTRGFWASLLSAILSLVIGGLLLAKPLEGLLTLTSLLLIFFFIEGLFKVALAFSLKGKKGWEWILVSGLISLFLGCVIIAGWPGTALWTLGLLVGINMLFFGCSLLLLNKRIPPNNP